MCFSTSSLYLPPFNDLFLARLPIPVASPPRLSLLVTGLRVLCRPRSFSPPFFYWFRLLRPLLKTSSPLIPSLPELRLFKAPPNGLVPLILPWSRPRCFAWGHFYRSVFGWEATWCACPRPPFAPLFFPPPVLLRFPGKHPRTRGGVTGSAFVAGRMSPL